MEENEKYIELSKKIENDREFDNWIQYMKNIVQDESKMDEVDEFLKQDLIGVLFEEKVITNSQKRKEAFDLIKTIYEYCEKNSKSKFKYLAYEGKIDEKFEQKINKSWDNIFDFENMSNEELDALYVDYFGMMDYFYIDTMNFFDYADKFKGNFYKSKFYENIKKYILEKKISDRSKFHKIENFLYNINTKFCDGKMNILDSIQSENEEKSELLTMLKTSDIKVRLENFCELKNDISDEDKKAIKDYFENYFEETIKLADKYPDVLKIALFAERIGRFEYYNPTDNRREMYHYIEDKYEKIGKGIIQNIDVEKIKEGDLRATLLATDTLNVLIEGFTFYSEIVDAFNYLKDDGIDYIETDVYRKFSENTYCLLFDEIIEKRKNGNKKFEEEEEEIEADVKKIEDFFEISQRELIKRKPSLFSREGITINNILNVHNINENEDLGFYALINEQYDIDNINLEEEKNIVEEYIRNNDIVENEEEFDVFLCHLQNVKLKEKDNKLPMKYVKYIIKQGLSDSIIFKNEEKYRYLLESVVLDFARNDLPIKIQKNKPYVFQFLDNLGRTCENGLHDNNGYIKYKREQLRQIFTFGNFELFNTIFHENVHASQYYDFENSENRTISYNRYVMEKEEILINLLPTFYANNYENTFIEIEANEKAAKKTLDFLNSLYPNESRDKKIKYETLGNMLDRYTRVFNEKKNAYIPSESVQVDDKEKNVYELFDEKILENPKCLEKYPDLLLEYNSNGIPKTFEELLNQGMMAEKTDEKYLMAKIINKSQRMNYRNFSNEMNALMKCFVFDGYENFTQNSLVGNAFLKKIIIENVGNIANQIFDNRENMIQSELLEVQQTISIINENMLKPEYKKFADAMNSLNSRNPNMKKTPIEALAELEQKIPNYIIKDNEDVDFMRSAYETTEEKEIFVLENLFVNSVDVSNRTVSKEAEKERDNEDEEKI